MRRRPHPFAWLLAAAFVVAVVAAALAPDRAPAIALYWNPIYRAEIALVVLGLPARHRGLDGVERRSVPADRAARRRGAALERDAAELDSAATDFDGFSESIIARLEALEASMDDVIERLTRLEAGSTGPESRVP